VTQPANNRSRAGSQLGSARAGGRMKAGRSAGTYQADWRQQQQQQARDACSSFGMDAPLLAGPVTDGAGTGQWAAALKRASSRLAVKGGHAGTGGGTLCAAATVLSQRGKAKGFFRKRVKRRHVLLKMWQASSSAALAGDWTGVR
jgi:hypothetical protein